MLDLIIHGGDVVAPQGVGKWDVAVKPAWLGVVALAPAGPPGVALAADRP